MNNWKMKWNTSVGYHWVQHRFCIDVGLLMDDVLIAITQQTRLIECQKVLIGYLFDFGQYAPWDSNSDSR